jgi:hypothetical protein
VHLRLRRLIVIGTPGRGKTLLQPAQETAARPHLFSIERRQAAEAPRLIDLLIAKGPRVTPASQLVTGMVTCRWGAGRPRARLGERLASVGIGLSETEPAQLRGRARGGILIDAAYGPRAAVDGEVLPVLVDR